MKAANFEKIQINGNKRISDETVKIYGKIDANKTNYDERELDIILKNLYETNFFEDVTIEIVNKVLKINLKEYPFINQIIIVGENSKKYKDQIKKIIRSKKKDHL